MTSRTPSLREIIGLHVDVALDGLRVAMPGRIESYDPSTGRASIVPLLMVPVHKDDGTVESVALRKLVEVPVLMPGAGGRYVKLPVTAGDACLLIFADFSVDEWKAKGGVVDPKGLGQHAIADAFAIVGLRAPESPPPQASIEILPDGKVVLDGGGQGVGMGHSIRQELDALWNILLGHVHGPANTPAQTGPVFAPPTFPSGSPVGKVAAGGGLVVESGNVTTS